MDRFHMRVGATIALVLTIGACGSSAEPIPTSPSATTIPTSFTSVGSTTSSAEPSTPTSTAAPATTTTVTPATVVTSTTLQGETIEVVVANGEVKGPGRVKVALGTKITIVVTADVADEVHLHGYDILAEVGPSQAAIIELEATIPGIFEVELEGARLELVLIEVS